MVAEHGASCSEVAVSRCVRLRRELVIGRDRGDGPRHICTEISARPVSVAAAFAAEPSPLMPLP